MVTPNILSMVRTLVPLSLAIVAFACQEPNVTTGGTDNSNEKDLWTIMTANTNGVISIVASRHLNYSGAQYTDGGTVVANPASSTPENGGTMTAGGVAITPNVNNVYNSDVQGGFGTTCTYGLTGNSAAGIPAFSTTMYVPTEIMMNGPLTTSISKTTGATVTWNVDPSNTDPVVVFARYEIALSRDINPAMPTGRIVWHTNVTDNGAYTLTNTDLAAFPAGSRVRIGIARGAVKTHNVSGDTYYLVGYSAADNIYEITP